MGCHTWVYCHDPKRDGEFREKIKEYARNTKESLTDYYTSPLYKDENLKDYGEFISECRFFNGIAESGPSDEEIYNDYGLSGDEFRKKYEWSKKAVSWSYDEYIGHLIAEAGEDYETCERGGLPEYGAFDVNREETTYGGYNLYRVVNGKLYVYGIIPHGDDLGRIHDYEQPDCFTADDAINAFKSRHAPCKEFVIRELFDNNDIFIHFG